MILFEVFDLNYKVFNNKTFDDGYNLKQAFHAACDWTGCDATVFIPAGTNFCNEYTRALYYWVNIRPEGCKEFMVCGHHIESDSDVEKLLENQ